MATATAQPFSVETSQLPLPKTHQNREQDKLKMKIIHTALTMQLAKLCHSAV